MSNFIEFIPDGEVKSIEGYYTAYRSFASETGRQEGWFICTMCHCDDHPGFTRVCSNGPQQCTKEECLAKCEKWNAELDATN